MTSYEYDEQDRLVKVTAPNGVVTEYEYDIISRRTREISPDRGTISYRYDLADNVIAVTDGRGITATLTYDELERIHSKTYPNSIAGKNENVTYSYDTCPFGLGHLCARDDESGEYAYHYDAFGNLTEAGFSDIAGTVYSTGYRYDDGDRIIRMTLPGGRIVDYSRDGIRRLEAIDTTLNGTAQNIVSHIQYRGDNQMTQCTYGNGLNDTRSYDLQGRLKTQQLSTAANTLIDQRSYRYDKNGNTLGIDSNLEDNGYRFDKIDRLITDGINNDSPDTFGYDLNDNRLNKVRQDGSENTQYHYLSGSNRLQASDSIQIGNSPQPGPADRELIYNDAGRLYQLIEQGSLKAEYIYNDRGQRTRKTVYQAGGIGVAGITVYHYDQLGNLISETTADGQLIKDYIWQDGSHPIAQIDQNGGAESLIYLYTDHLMTNRLATDQSQTIVWRWEGEAFGNTPPEESAGVSVNLRFPGQYFDRETGWFYNYYRYYDPSTGRYITSDPIGLAGGLNTYGYVGGDPLRFTDPLGLEAAIPGFPSSQAIPRSTVIRPPNPWLLLFYPPAAGEGSDIVPHQSSIWDDLDGNVPESAADDIPGSNTLPDSESKKDRCIQKCYPLLEVPGLSSDIRTNNFNKCLNSCLENPESCE